MVLFMLLGVSGAARSSQENGMVKHEKVGATAENSLKSLNTGNRNTRDHFSLEK